MTFEEFLNAINDYMALDTLDGYLEAKKLVTLACEEFVNPDELEKISDISSSIMLYSGELLVREHSSRGENYNDFDDEDDEEDIITVKVGSGKSSRIS